MRRKIAAGNWKMNGSRAALKELDALETHGADGAEVIMALPFPYLAEAAAQYKDKFAIAAQDCSEHDKGAYTGEVSASMLADIGVSHVVLGHSERRAMFGDTDARIHAKAEAAWSAGLVAIICVGETLEEREEGRADAVVSVQIAGSIPDGATAQNTIIAYEPVWAIGTGKTASPQDCNAMHTHIRHDIENRFGDDGREMRVLYGGSVKPDNAAELFSLENVDGGLVGGASLKAADFNPIIVAAN